MNKPAVHDLSPALARFRADVLRGLSRSPKRLPCKYFYDEAGSKLFEQICQLSEYYPTRTELGILRADAGAIAARLAEGHVVAHDLHLLAVLHDRGEDPVGRGRGAGIVEFDIGQLGPADDELLLLRGQCVPLPLVVEVFLHDHVATGSERRILRADERGVDGLLPPGVLRPIDKS